MGNLNPKTLSSEVKRLNGKTVEETLKGILDGTEKIPLKDTILWEGRWAVSANGTLATKDNCYGHRKFYLQLEAGVLLEGTRHNDGRIRFVYDIDGAYWVSFLIAASSIQCEQASGVLTGLIVTKLLAIQ